MSSQTPPGPSPVTPTFSVLVFSKTAGFRHDSIPAGIDAIRQQGSARGFSVDASEDAAVFTDESLAKYKVVMFLSTTGDVLNPAQEAAFERFIRRGGGFVGVHSATDTEYDWPFYGGPGGRLFRGASRYSERDDSDRGFGASGGGVAAAAVDAPRRVVQLPAQSARQRHRAGDAGRAHVQRRNDGARPSDHVVAHLRRRAVLVHGGWATRRKAFRRPLFVEHLGRAILWAAGAI